MPPDAPADPWRPVEPLLVPVEVFAELDAALVGLLRRLAPDDWHRPTVCSRWCVKDVAAHLLDTCLRRLSAQRDGYRPPGARRGFASNADLVAYLAELNAAWTTAAAQLSPRVLVGLLESGGVEFRAWLASLDPFAPAAIPVAWAGERESANWMDVAREYTERWHHHQQIIEAVAPPGRADAPVARDAIQSRRLYHPALDAFARALPFTFRDVAAPDGASVALAVTGEAGSAWTLLRRSGQWHLGTGAPPHGPPATTVIVPQDVAWLCFTKRADRAAKLARFPSVRITGDRALGEVAVDMVSIMA